MNVAPVQSLYWQTCHRGGAGPREGVMHPMFVELYFKTDEDDLLAYEEGKRQSRRARRGQARTLTRTTVRGRGDPSRRR